MSEIEGVIKFQLDFDSAPAPEWEPLVTLNAWRKILHLTDLIGQKSDLYEGYAYGNVSMRLPNNTGSEKPAFIICGTQTGGLLNLHAEHYTLVLSCHHQENKVVARGPITPSSEAMTHSIFYEQDVTIGCVLHAHSSLIWQRSATLGLPTTAADIPYGTPQMADAVKILFEKTDLAEQRILSMGGHQDGIISFGADPHEAGAVMMKTLARSLALS